MPEIDAPSFAAIVRTTGSRPQELLEALQSVALQKLPCMAVVVAHGDDAAAERVRDTCAGNADGQPLVILHAPDTARKEGYPLNVGLDHCLAVPSVKYVFTLDDDDIVYPYFTYTMAAAFVASEADVVYAICNRREPGQLPTAGFARKPFYHLFHTNFIVTNSYAIRAAALRQSG